jgi:hypothetical protein
MFAAEVIALPAGFMEVAEDCAAVDKVKNNALLLCILNAVRDTAKLAGSDAADHEHEGCNCFCAGWRISASST